MTPRALRLRIGCLLTATVGCSEAAEPGRPTVPSPIEEVVELPAMFVVEGRGVPDWLHVAFPDGEILAACSKTEARDFAVDFHRHREMVRTLVPAELRGDFDRPELLILFDQASLNPMPAEIARAARSVAGPRKVEPVGAPRMDGFPAMRLRPATMPNLTVMGEDLRATSIEFDDEWRGFRGQRGVRLRLSEQFVRMWLLRRRPALPAWYVDGVCELAAQIEPSSRDLAFRRLRWRGLDPRTSRFVRRLTLGPLELFGAPADPANERLGRERAEHLALFLRWALDGDDPARPAKLAALVRRAGAEPVTPGLLQECLGLSAEELREQLDRKLTKVVARPVVLRARLEAPKDAVVVRPAPLAVSASLLAEWHRLAALHVADQPAMKQRYLVQATEQVRRMYGQGSRDPAVVTALALAEFEAGRRESALPLLESAALAPEVRPAVWRALAETRLADFAAAPTGEGGRLGETQTVAVLEPIRRALAANAPAPDAYLVLAHTWLVSGLQASAEDLARLREAVRRFPEHARLVRRCADACARHGQLEWAREMASEGYAAARTPADRDALELLEIRLEAETPGR